MKPKRAMPTAVYFMAFANFVSGVNTLVIAGVITEIAATARVSVGQAGQLITIYSLAYAIFAPIMMGVTSRFERRKVLAIALLGVMVGNAIFAFGSSYIFLMIARILTAVGAAAYVPLSAAVAISLVEPEQRGEVSAIVFTGFTIATALGLPIGTWVGLNFGWRLTVGAVAVLAFISSLLLWRELPHDIETPPVNLAIFGQVFQNVLLVVVLSVTILQFAGQMAIFAFLTPWLQAFTSLDTLGISVMLLLIGVGGIFGNYVGGIATDRFGAKETQVLQIIVMAITLALLPLTAQNVFIGAVLMLSWGFVGQGFIAPQLVRIVNIDGVLSSAALSLNSSFINVGVSLGALSGGIFIDQVGVGWLTWLGVGGTLLSLMVFGYSWMLENRQATVAV